MRSEKLINDGSVCEGDFDGDATTEEEYQAESHAQCRFFPHECPVIANPGVGPYCIPRAAHDIARFVIKDRTAVELELRDFGNMAPFPPKGFFDPTREEQDSAITDKAEILSRMGVWANHILGVQPVDSATLNREYKDVVSAVLLEKYKVLAESVYDESQSIWTHSCGSLLVVADVIHQIRHKAMPLAGPGQVQHEAVPYCGNCSEIPNVQGNDVYVEDLEREEEEFLRRLGDSSR